MDFTYYFVLGYSCSVVMATGDVVLVVKVGVVSEGGCGYLFKFENVTATNTFSR